MLCAWHECGRAFEPTNHRQQFCCPSCRIARGVWKSRRGAPLVDLLLAGDAAGLVAEKKKIQKEIDDALT